MGQMEYRGSGSICNLDSILEGLKAKRILLVFGKTSFPASGARDKVLPVLEKYKVLDYSDFGVNPQVVDIERCAGLFRTFQPDTVLVVGGGSSMDVAKVASLLSLNDLTVEQWFTGNRPEFLKKIPIVAVPTTAGSGSEATKFGVFYDGKNKLSLAEDSILPSCVILDPELMMSLSEYQAATGGMDALSQAVEAYWSIYSTDESKAYSRRSMMLCVEHLVQSVNFPDIRNRNSMALAANLAGKAINITRTTACHAVSYPFTSYFGLAHGHAVGLTLSSMLRFIDGVEDDSLLDHRGCEYVRGITKDIALMLGAPAVEEACERLDEIMRSIGLKTHLCELGLESRMDIELVIENGFNPERVKNIPRVLKAQDLRDILIALF